MEYSLKNRFHTTAEMAINQVLQLHEELINITPGLRINKSFNFVYKIDAKDILSLMEVVILVQEFLKTLE